jgi:hypothetical protein
MTDHSNIPAVQSPIPVNKIKLGLNASSALVLVPIQPMRTAVTGVRERTNTARPRTVGFALHGSRVSVGPERGGVNRRGDGQSFSQVCLFGRPEPSCEVRRHDEVSQRFIASLRLYADLVEGKVSQTDQE